MRMLEMILTLTRRRRQLEQETGSDQRNQRAVHFLPLDLARIGTNCQNPLLGNGMLKPRYHRVFIAFSNVGVFPETLNLTSVIEGSPSANQWVSSLNLWSGA